MTLDAAFAEHVQKPNPGAVVILWEIDHTPLGASTPLRYTSGTFENQFVSFNGVDYYSKGIEGRQFAHNSISEKTEPALEIEDITGEIKNLARTYSDFEDQVVTRIKTTEQYLDGGSAGVNLSYPPSYWRIDRIKEADNEKVVFTLKAYADMRNLKMPGEIFHKSTCTRKYHYYSGGSWVYGDCPYRHANGYFDGDGNSTSAGNDLCARKEADCILRYGSNSVLPIHIFPFMLS